MNLRERMRRFGIDAPYVMISNMVIIVLSMVLHAFLRYYPNTFLAMITGILRNIAVISIVAIIFYVYSTTTGKFKIWKKLSVSMPMEGKFLDVGCGRGMVLTILGQTSDQRELYGIDIWSLEDQYKNSQENALANFSPHTAIKAELVTADARDMPFEDNFFDVIVSSLALHNIKNSAEEIKAIQEILRVLKPGGQLAISDIGFLKSPRYLVYTKTQLTDVTLGSSGLKGWYAPFLKTFVLQGKKKSHVLESHSPAA